MDKSNNKIDYDEIPNENIVLKSLEDKNLSNNLLNNCTNNAFDDVCDNDKDFEHLDTPQEIVHDNLQCVRNEDSYENDIKFEQLTINNPSSETTNSDDDSEKFEEITDNNAFTIPEVKSCTEPDVCSTNLNDTQEDYQNTDCIQNNSDCFDDFDDFVCADPKSLVVQSTSRTDVTKPNDDSFSEFSSREKFCSGSPENKISHDLPVDTCVNQTINDVDEAQNINLENHHISNIPISEYDNKSDVDEDDFVFQDFQSTNQSKPEEDHNSEINNEPVSKAKHKDESFDDDFEFQDFQSTNQSEPETGSNSGINDEPVSKAKHKDESFDDDFGDFNSFATDSVPINYHSNNASVKEVTPIDDTHSILDTFNENMALYKNKDFDTLYNKILSVIEMAFPAVAEEAPVQDHVIKDDDICVMDELKNVDITDINKFQWKNSQTFEQTLTALNIDSRNIVSIYAEINYVK